MTNKDLRLIATFIAGRIAAKEIEFGDSSFKSESKDQKYKRIDIALAELVDFLNRIKPELLPKEIRKICAKVKKDVQFDVN
jgi:hypothetical protein